MPNASVLPVPVLACPMMSCPRSASGRLSAWMGNVVTMPAAARPEQIASLMPKSLNGTACGLALPGSVVSPLKV
jgi:flagellar motor component MotA